MLQDVMMNFRVAIRKQSVCRVKKVKGDLRQKEKQKEGVHLQSTEGCYSRTELIFFKQ